MNGPAEPSIPDKCRLEAGQLRFHCDPGVFRFATTAELGDCPINIIGQDRAQEAIRLGLAVRAEGYNIFVTGLVGSGRSTVVRRLLGEVEADGVALHDLVYVNNFRDPDEPRQLTFPAGQGTAFQSAVEELLENLLRDLPQLFDSDLYRRRRSALLETAGNEQKARLREFERTVQSQGFALMQMQIGPMTRPHLVPLVAGNPVELEKLEELVEEGKFKREEFEQLQSKLTELRTEMEGLGKTFRKLDREVRDHIAELERELAGPLVREHADEPRASFGEVDGVGIFLDQVVEHVLDQLEAFREPGEAPAGGETGQHGPQLDRTPFAVNVLVDNARTEGRPVIRETAPSYRNLFGTIERYRTSNGEWETDHTRIKAGSLLRASGGFLVLDALDVLVEPGVWAALKRTLRNRMVEIQRFDPIYAFTGVSLKPQPVPIDVKVVLIGTPQIYRLLHVLDEDFKKIFKVKADFATHTPLNEEELENYACFVHKKVHDDRLPHFTREAVAAIVEQGVRLAGNRGKLTTRFNEIADLVREAGFWAAKAEAEFVGIEHVDQALIHKVHRVNLVEEQLRERIAEGTVLLDLAGSKVGQLNGLVVLDQGDHVFGLPSRITVTTAMGRAGILDLERQSRLSGSIHTKGVLILTGFLRQRFAQEQPLTLTATLCFEQSYGGVDGDSASAAELYALLSSLSGVPLRQGVAVTGSVNQRGEIQPIGGVNEKIEGFFDLCRLTGLDGTQGVMIPTRNLPHLHLRTRVVEAVRERRFHIWAVESIEQGLAVLSGVEAGERDAQGSYPEDSVFGRAQRKLRELAEQVIRFGPADGG